MRPDPLDFFQLYFDPEEKRPPELQQLKPATSAPGDFSIDALVSNRRKILEVKLAVFLAAARKRFVIRKQNLESLLDDELAIRTQKLQTPSYVQMDERRYPTDQSSHEQSLLEVERQRREEEASCWRDVVPVMRDVLTTWEALEQARARAIFLSSYPSDGVTKKGGEDDA